MHNSWKVKESFIRFVFLQKKRGNHNGIHVGCAKFFDCLLIFACDKTQLQDCKLRKGHLPPSMQTFCFISSVTSGLNIFHKIGKILGARQTKKLFNYATFAMSNDTSAK